MRSLRTQQSGPNTRPYTTTISLLIFVVFQSAQYVYHCSVRFFIKKVWNADRSLHLNDFHPVQYILVRNFGSKLAISCTFPIDRCWGGERARRV